MQFTKFTSITIKYDFISYLFYLFSNKFLNIYYPEIPINALYKRFYSTGTQPIFKRARVPEVGCARTQCRVEGCLLLPGGTAYRLPEGYGCEPGVW